MRDTSPAALRAAYESAIQASVQWEGVFLLGSPDRPYLFYLEDLPRLEGEAARAREASREPASAPISPTAGGWGPGRGALPRRATAGGRGPEDPP